MRREEVLLLHINMMWWQIDKKAVVSRKQCCLSDIIKQVTNRGGALVCNLRNWGGKRWNRWLEVYLTNFISFLLDNEFRPEES